MARALPGCVSPGHVLRQLPAREKGASPDGKVADGGPSRGIEPSELVTYPGKARKAIYRDADGNEIVFGGAID